MSEIPQKWIDDIQRVNQILLKISSDAFDNEADHLEAVSSLASAACERVLNLLDPERLYDLESDTFSNMYDIIIPSYKDTDSS